MANTQNSKQQSAGSSVPIWLVLVIVLVFLCTAGVMALMYQQSSSGTVAVVAPTQAVAAVAPSVTSSPTGSPQGPTETPTWTPRPSRIPYITPTFVNTAVPAGQNTRSSSQISSGINTINTGGVTSGGSNVVVPTVTPAIPRSTQTAVAATATQAVTATQVAGTATSIAATATQISATATQAANFPTPFPGTWHGVFFNNRNLEGQPVLARNNPANTSNNPSLLFNWGSAAPVNGINADNFSVRWTLNTNFNGANFIFYAFSDDGIRVFVDGNRIIDNWTNATNRVLYGTIGLAAGTHEVRVEYFENTGDARVAVGWQQAVNGAWVGEYFSNNSLGDPPVYIQQDNQINFNWGSGSPNGIPADNFSVRWGIDYNFGNAATYRFVVTVDDGVRVRVGGTTIIDQWRSVDGPQIYTFEGIFSGTQRITTEYFNGSGNAQIKVDISRPGTATPDATATSAAAATATAAASATSAAAEATSMAAATSTAAAEATSVAAATSTAAAATATAEAPAP